MAYTPETCGNRRMLDVPRSRVRFWMREPQSSVLSRTDGFQIGARNQRNRHKVQCHKATGKLHLQDNWSPELSSIGADLLPPVLFDAGARHDRASKCSGSSARAPRLARLLHALR